MLLVLVHSDTQWGANKRSESRANTLTHLYGHTHNFVKQVLKYYISSTRLKYLYQTHTHTKTHTHRQTMTQREGLTQHLPLRLTSTPPARCKRTKHRAVRISLQTIEPHSEHYFSFAHSWVFLCQFFFISLLWFHAIHCFMFALYTSECFSFNHTHKYIKTHRHVHKTHTHWGPQRPDGAKFYLTTRPKKGRGGQSDYSAANWSWIKYAVELFTSRWRGVWGEQVTITQREKWKGENGSYIQINAPVKLCPFILSRVSKFCLPVL